MNSLAEVLTNHHDEIIKYLYIGYARWDDLISRVERQERKLSDDFDDEQIWTFLVGCGYAIAGKDGVAKLTKTLTGSDYEAPTNPRIWFEVLPIPPRKGEGETHLDLALGTIARRKGTKSGIELENVGMVPPVVMLGELFADYARVLQVVFGCLVPEKGQRNGKNRLFEG